MLEETDAGKAREAWENGDEGTFAVLTAFAQTDHDVPNGQYRWRFRDRTALSMNIASLMVHKGL